MLSQDQGQQYCQADGGIGRSPTIDGSAPAPFEVVESQDADGLLHVALVGELDLATADHLSSRLGRLTSNGTRVRLDLSRLEFVDIVGLRALTRAAQLRHPEGDYLLEVGREIRQGVQRVIDLVGVAPIVWPKGQSVE